jgi:hypothetical protein
MSTIAKVAALLLTPAKILYYPEAASQSFKKGEFVYLVSGKVTVVSSTVPSQTKILGLAMQDASGTTDTALAVAIVEEGVAFEMNVTTTTAITQVGAVYGLSISSNKHSVAIADTTNTVFKVKAISPRDAVGDTYGRVIVEVLGSRCQTAGQTS